MAPVSRLRVGYVSGRAKRVNERAIDEHFISSFRNYVDLVEIQPLIWLRLVRGSFEKWTNALPKSLHSFISDLREIQIKYQLDFIYANLPALVPYLMLARNAGHIPLGIISFAHSVASEPWLKRWVATAPFITDKDVLLVSTKASHEALLNISPAYRSATLLPLSISLNERAITVRLERNNDKTKNSSSINFLTIGRIENVKNVHRIITWFSEIRKSIPRARLIVVGEYTGDNRTQLDDYKELIKHTIDKTYVGDSVEFTGPLEGTQKIKVFVESDVLINCSIDPGETFGYNLIEAKKWGLPVVCSNWSGFHEVVTDQQEGFLADCSWVDECPSVAGHEVIAKCIQLGLDPELRSIMAENAASKLNQYDQLIILPQIVEKMESALEAILPETKPSDCIEMFMTPISSCHRVWHLDRLSMLDFEDMPVMNVLKIPDNHLINDWYPKVKPIIKHFAISSLHTEPLISNTVPSQIIR